MTAILSDLALTISLSVLAVTASAAPLAIVPNYGPRNDTAVDDVVVLDMATSVPSWVATFPVENAPYDTAVHPEQPRYVYAVNQGAESVLPKTVSVIDTDPAVWTVVDTIPVGRVPYAIAFTPDGSRAFVSNRRSDTITIIDTDRGSPTLHSTITLDLEADMAGFGSACDGDAFYPSPPTCGPKGLATDGSYLYITNYFDDTVAVMDIRLPYTFPYRIVAVIDPPGSCGPGAPCLGPRSLVLSPDGNTLFVVWRIAEVVSSYDVSTPAAPTLDAIAATGQSPRGIALSTTLDELYVVNYDSDDLSVFDSATMVAIAGPGTAIALPLGDGPFGAAVTPAGDALVVTNFLDHSVSHVDLVGGTWTTTTTPVTALDFPAGLGAAWLQP